MNEEERKDRDEKLAETLKKYDAWWSKKPPRGRGPEFSGMDLKGLTLCDRNLQHARMAGCKFDEADLKGVDFREALLKNASFDGADLGGVDFTGAILRNASFDGADLGGVDFTGAGLGNANFFEARMDGVKGLHKAKFANPPTNTDAVRLSRFQKWFGWDAISKIGRLPIFSASIISLVVLPVVLYWFDFYNQQIELGTNWAEQAANDPSDAVHYLSVTLKDEKLWHKIDVPPRLLAGYTFAFLLFFASAIYAVFCPKYVKQYTEEEWCFTLGKERLVYLGWAWTHPGIRFSCQILFLFGGLGVVSLLLSKAPFVFRLLIKQIMSYF